MMVRFTAIGKGFQKLWFLSLNISLQEIIAFILGNLGSIAACKGCEYRLGHKSAINGHG